MIGLFSATGDLVASLAVSRRTWASTHPDPLSIAQDRGLRHLLFLNNGNFVSPQQFSNLPFELFGLDFQLVYLDGDRFGEIGSDLV